MLRVKDIIKKLKIFKRNKIPIEIKTLAIATYIQTSSVRRTARILSEIYPVSKTSVWNWINKFKEELSITTEERERDLIAVDETVVKGGGKHYYVYSAVDVERNELILMRVYTIRNHLITRSFVKKVLKYCRGEPKFLIDKAPWLISALKSLNLNFEHQTFGRGSLIESVFSSLKQRVKIFFCSINAKNPVRNWNFFCRLFVLYYNKLRWCLC
ncbi:DDE-type integrase/transposase/recombinase [Methanofervidicoccus sp. A16]|uniref:DDE-type integrase/transposase/recombinase n=1 Tax=Methanofervidicoccus sp. A16 TaxID=2607662 RepID=UPI0011D11FB0|nr:DDE-type integrase/transposase/recombinase [Methanofervidicoccus sp. A16]